MIVKLEGSRIGIGLHDKLGKEICEGDILLIPDTYKDVVCDDGTGPIYDECHLAPVIWLSDVASWGVNIFNSGEDLSKGTYTFESIINEITLEEIMIIGNVYENPELIAGE